MVVVSRSGTEYHRAEPLDDWEALRWRELEWGALPHTTRKGTIPYLTAREVGRLDCAMTNREARPHRQILQGHAVPCFQWVHVRVQGRW